MFVNGWKAAQATVALLASLGIAACGQSSAAPESDASRFELTTDSQGRKLRMDRHTGETFVLEGNRFVPLKVQSAPEKRSRASQELKSSQTAPGALEKTATAPGSAPSPEPSVQPGSTVSLKSSAPIFLLPESNREPLVVASESSTAKVISSEPGWYQVQFKDSRFERRIGYVERRYVGSIVEPPSAPMTTSSSTLGVSGLEKTSQASQPELMPQKAPEPAQPVRTAGKQRVRVQIIGRQSHETGYTFTVPGSWNSTGSSYVDCSGYGSGNVTANRFGNTVTGRVTTNSSANCYGTSQSSGTITPPREVSYVVSGATLSLQLPDGRVVVTNCDSKISWPTRRSCRVPMVADLFVEFSGSNAKLIWSVSLDRSTMENETYKVLAILERPVSK